MDPSAAAPAATAATDPMDAAAESLMMVKSAGTKTTKASAELTIYYLERCLAGNVPDSAVHVNIVDKELFKNSYARVFPNLKLGDHRAAFCVIGHIVATNLVDTRLNTDPEMYYVGVNLFRLGKFIGGPNTETIWPVILTCEIALLKLVTSA